jgi:hypothetical protein
VLPSNYEVLALNNSLANDFVEIEIAWNNGDADASTQAYQAPHHLTQRATTHKTKSSTQALAPPTFRTTLGSTALVKAIKRTT